MADIDNVKMAQGQAKLATEEDLQRDAVGITNPNLHRRIDQDLSFTSEDTLIGLSTGDEDLVTEDNIELTTEDNLELTTESEDGVLGTNNEEAIILPTRIVGGKANYTISVSGVNSYRTTNQITHDEDSNTDEIP